MTLGPERGSAGLHWPEATIGWLVAGLSLSALRGGRQWSLRICGGFHQSPRQASQAPSRGPPALCVEALPGVPSLCRQARLPRSPPRAPVRVDRAPSCTHCPRPACFREIHPGNPVSSPGCGAHGLLGRRLEQTVVSAGNLGPELIQVGLRLPSAPAPGFGGQVGRPQRALRKWASGWDGAGQQGTGSESRRRRRGWGSRRLLIRAQDGTRAPRDNPRSSLCRVRHGGFPRRELAAAHTTGRALLRILARGRDG